MKKKLKMIHLCTKQNACNSWNKLKHWSDSFLQLHNRLVQRSEMGSDVKSLDVTRCVAHRWQPQDPVPTFSLYRDPGVYYSAQQQVLDSLSFCPAVNICLVVCLPEEDKVSSSDLFVRSWCLMKNELIFYCSEVHQSGVHIQVNVLPGSWFYTHELNQGDEQQSNRMECLTVGGLCSQEDILNDWW